MKKQLRIAITLSLGLLTASAAMADDAVWGALLGGGAGAAIGHSVNGRNGAVVVVYLVVGEHPSRVAAVAQARDPPLESPAGQVVVRRANAA